MVDAVEILVAQKTQDSEKVRRTVTETLDVMSRLTCRRRKKRMKDDDKEFLGAIAG